jgi:hypothetical protein
VKKRETSPPAIRLTPSEIESLRRETQAAYALLEELDREEESRRAALAKAEAKPAQP